MYSAKLVEFELLTINIYMYENVNDFNDKNTDLMDYLGNDENFKKIPKELLAQGKSVIDNNPDIANGQYYIIEPNGKVFLIHIKGKENVKERELTEDEYKIVKLCQVHC